jgi:AraC-like DNA-binding protein
VYACGNELIGDMLPTRLTANMKRYGLVYLVHGRGVFESASFPATEVSPGQALLLFPDEPHRYGAPAGGAWEEYWFRVDGPTIRDLHGRGVLDKRTPVFNVGLDAEYVTLFDRMIQIAAEPAADKRLIPGMVMHLPNSTLVPRRPPALSDTAAKVLAIAEKVRRDPRRAWRFVDLARDHGLSYSLLRRQMTLRVGVPPHQYLLRERMRLACESLARGSSVKEACEYVGMSDPYHFSKLFKKVMGQAPRAYSHSVRRQGHTAKRRAAQSGGTATY